MQVAHVHAWHCASDNGYMCKGVLKGMHALRLVERGWGQFAQDCQPAGMYKCRLSTSSFRLENQPWWFGFDGDLV